MHNYIPDLVQEEESCFLVPERDVDDLTKKRIYLIEHPEIWAEIVLVGRKYVEENYDINVLNDRLVELYQQLLDGRLSNVKVNKR